MRNTIILVDQIDHDIAAGHGRHRAIIDATVRRTRPVLLTALAAILGMIPLAGSIFWGPMAITIMGGLFRGDLIDAARRPRPLRPVVPRSYRRALGYGRTSSSDGSA
jgi:multidrug efflux pump subunit AcrB